MQRVSASVTLNCPIQNAFAFINDQRNHALLNPHNFYNYRVISAHSVGVGAQSQFVLRTGAFQEPVKIRVVESQPDHSLVEEGRLRGARFRVRWQLQPASAERTELEVTTEYVTDSGLASLMQGMITRAFVRIYTRLLEDLAARLNQCQVYNQ